MCAEALPWRCHRSLVADAKIACAIKLLHIVNKTTADPYLLTNFAIVDKKKRTIKIIYTNKNN